MGDDDKDARLAEVELLLAMYPEIQVDSAPGAPEIRLSMPMGGTQLATCECALAIALPPSYLPRAWVWRAGDGICRG